MNIATQYLIVVGYYFYKKAVIYTYRLFLVIVPTLVCATNLSTESEIEYELRFRERLSSLLFIFYFFLSVFPSLSLSLSRCPFYFL